MPVNEMHESFLHFYDKQSNFAAPEVTAEEIDIYLNYAQEKFLKYLTEKGVEKSEEWADYTKNLLRRATIDSTSGLFSNNPSSNKPYGQFVLFQGLNTSRLILSEEVLIQFPNNPTCSGETSSRIPVVPISRDEYAKAVKNPFRKPWREEILRLNRSESSNEDRVELIGFQGCTIVAYYVDYLKDPFKIQYGTLYSTPTFNQDCELDYKAAVQIIEMAVSFALQTIGDPRIATKQYDKLIKTV